MFNRSRLTKYPSETAVASGAVLRALNKENGPARTTLSSYGFLRIEPYEPEVLHAHRNGVRPYHDPLDGKKYVKNTVDWLVKKVCIVGSRTFPDRALTQNSG